MPARAHLLRQLHIVRRLQAVRGRALPFAEIQRYLLHETSVGDFEADYTLRTFQRDKQEIIDLFGPPSGTAEARATTSPKPSRRWPSTPACSKPWSFRSFCGCW
jgi:hypothetical protein